jgi:hypothetical protein
MASSYKYGKIFEHFLMYIRKPFLIYFSALAAF